MWETPEFKTKLTFKPRNFIRGGIVTILLFQLPLTGAAQVMPEADSSGPAIITRGEAVETIVSSFDLEKKQHPFLADCLFHADDCFFAFSAMSDFDGIRFKPLILYPDVFPAYKYYGAVNTASILGLVHGFLDEESTPFHPEQPMTRIQALKVTLGAAGLMGWKEKFELTGEVPDAGGPEDAYFAPFKDVPQDNPDMWWYHRYLNYSLQAGIIDPADTFRPDDPVSARELKDFIEKTIVYAKVSGDDKQTAASGNTQQ